MKTKVSLWIDHRKAIVVTIKDQAAVTAMILNMAASPFAKRVHISDT